MERITYRLTLDAHKSGVQKILQGFQTADNVARRVVVSIASGSNTIDLDCTDTVAMMYVTTPNATEPSINACAIENNTIIYDVLPIVEEGITEMQIKLVTTSPNGADRVLACPKFAVEVTESGLDDSGAEQTTTFTALEQAVAQANGVYNSRLIRVDVDDDCTFRAYFADGTVYETDSFNVALGNYTSSAKEYADNASLSELNAKVSETNAKLSEENAKAYEELAKKYMESASILTPEAYAKVTEDVDALEEGFEELSGNVASLTQGYGQLAEDTSLLDIKTTTDTTLVGSKAGGYKLLSMSGKSMQKAFSGNNLWSLGDQSFTKSVEFAIDLPIGTYTFSATVVSSGTDKDVSNAIFYDEDNVAYTVSLSRGVRNSGTFTITKPIVKVLLLAETISSLSSGDTATYSNIQLEKGSAMTDYEPYIGGVEMVQGLYSASDGTFSGGSHWVCNRNPIPCASGDTISLAFENAFEIVYVLYYNNGAFVSSVDITSTRSATVPSGVTHFNFEARKQDVTLSTAGKINLTVNGKPIRVNNGLYDGGATSPSPYMPQSINNVGDCVDMIQGYYNRNTGVYTSNGNWLCNKNPIACKSGDVIAITVESTIDDSLVIFYNGGNYLSASALSTSGATAPSGATHFVFSIRNLNGLTVDTVGKISLTINGKYVVQIVENGKNLLKATEILQGVRASANGNYSSNNSWVTVGNNDFAYVEQGKTYSVSANGVNWTRCDLLYYNENKAYISSSAQTIGTSVFVPNRTGYVKPQFYNANGIDATKVVGFQIELGELTDYEPYKEKVATVLLDTPLRETDVMGNKEVVRKRIKLVYDGSDDENWQSSMSVVGRYLILTKQPIKVGWDARGLCTQAMLSAETTDINKFYITASGQIAINTNFSTLDEWKAHLQANPLEVELELATPTIETLDADSQIALNSLETFDGVTYSNVDSRTLPSEVKGEYGTSKVGAGVLKALNDSDTQAIKAKEFITVGTEELEVGVAKLPTGSIYIMYE